MAEMRTSDKSTPSQPTAEAANADAEERKL